MNMSLNFTIDVVKVAPMGLFCALAFYLLPKGRPAGAVKCAEKTIATIIECLRHDNLVNSETYPNKMPEA